jgi:hypothetical protein
VNRARPDALPLPPLPLGAAAPWHPSRRAATRRHVLIGALAASLALHLALTQWPIAFDALPEMAPLQVTITEMPPPPKPAAAVAAAPARAKRTARRPTPPSTPPPAPLAVPGAAPAPADETLFSAAPAEAVAPMPAVSEPPTEIVAAADTITAYPPVQLPPRLELAYTVFLGTQGFMIGEATYRFEHTGNQYRIATVAQASGLAALLIRGKGKLESRGLITPTGLLPQEFAIERGSADRREVAHFDWESGVVTLHGDQTETLEIPTFDPLVVMWQSYFSPPTGDEQSFNLATTRRVRKYTVTREGSERIEWKQGEILTERWHRRSDDGKTDGYVWVAPSLHYVPVKLRVVATNRGTLEALLDSIRIDEPVAQR